MQGRTRSHGGRRGVGARVVMRLIGGSMRLRRVVGGRHLLLVKPLAMRLVVLRLWRPLRRGSYSSSAGDSHGAGSIGGSIGGSGVGGDMAGSSGAAGNVHALAAGRTGLTTRRPHSLRSASRGTSNAISRDALYVLPALPPALPRPRQLTGIIRIWQQQVQSIPCYKKRKLSSTLSRPAASPAARVLRKWNHDGHQQRSPSGSFVQQIPKAGSSPSRPPHLS